MYDIVFYFYINVVSMSFHFNDLIIFLGPSMLAKYCSETNFIINIWDLDHRKNNQFPEHNYNFTFEKREDYLYA